MIGIPFREFFVLKKRIQLSVCIHYSRIYIGLCERVFLSFRVGENTLYASMASIGRVELLLFLGFFWGTCYGAWRNFSQNRYTLCALQLLALAASVSLFGYFVTDASEFLESTIFISVFVAVAFSAWRNFAKKQYSWCGTQLISVCVALFVTWNVIVGCRSEYSRQRKQLRTWRKDHIDCQDEAADWLDSPIGAARCAIARNNHAENAFWLTVSNLFKQKGFVRLFTNTGVGEIGANVLGMGFAPMFAIVTLTIIFGVLTVAMSLGIFWIIRVYPRTQRLPSLNPGEVYYRIANDEQRRPLGINAPHSFQQQQQQRRPMLQGIPVDNRSMSRLSRSTTSQMEETRRFRSSNIKKIL